MYENVIVPFDGTQPGRAALAPAADLAWRSGARVVIVNNTDASDRASRDALKSRAMSLSGADVDFWVDLDHSLGVALVEAAKFRSKPIICISVKGKQGGLFGKRWTLPQLGEDVLRQSPVPVLVIGPETDTSRGLPMSEIVVSTDGSSASEQIIPLAVDWAAAFKLRFILVGVVHQDSTDNKGELDYLARHVDAVRGKVPEARFELLRATDPASGLIEFLDEHDDAVIAMSTHGRSGVSRSALGTVALKVVAHSKRAVLLQRPTEG
ncbi:MAG: universal stress protein [Acidimicrobiales bacterium]|nr:universal stress protein [Acidimicrobiales bacterium]